MGIPGGGRSVISMRTQRHFNLITYTDLGTDSIDIMFKTIMRHFLRRFDDNVKEQTDALVKSTQDAYKSINDQLRPRPATSHYLFNLRDMSKVIQGVVSGHEKFIVGKEDAVRIWYHENLRVYGDRLISVSDNSVLETILMESVAGVFKMNRDMIFESERLIYGDF
jgi:dynein heavy chain